MAPRGAYWRRGGLAALTVLVGACDLLVDRGGLIGGSRAADDASARDGGAFCDPLRPACADASDGVWCRTCTDFDRALPFGGWNDPSIRPPGGSVTLDDAAFTSAPHSALFALPQNPPGCANALITRDPPGSARRLRVAAAVRLGEQGVGPFAGTIASFNLGACGFRLIAQRDNAARPYVQEIHLDQPDDAPRPQLPVPYALPEGWFRFAWDVDTEAHTMTVSFDDAGPAAVFANPIAASCKPGEIHVEIGFSCTYSPARTFVGYDDVTIEWRL